MRNLEGPNFDKCECGHTRFVHVVKHGDVHECWTMPVCDCSGFKESREVR